MTKQSTQDIVMPGKFLSLMLHLIITTMAYFSYQDNIIASYPSIASTTSTEWVGARVSFMACNTLTVIFLVLELIILFVGVTMFRERNNLVVSTLHYVGAILWSSYVFQQWQFGQLWAIWAACSLLPLLLQISAIISATRK